MSKFSILEICEKIGKMSSENIIFTMGLVTIKVVQYPRVLTTMAFCVL